MTTHQHEESNKTQLVADDTMEECMAHTVDSELALRNPVHKQHLVQESARETYWIVNHLVLKRSLRTYLWRETQG